MTTAGVTESNRAIERLLDERIGTLERGLDADVLTYMGPIAIHTDVLVRDASEHLDSLGQREARREKLAFLLETGGRYVETAERIANTLRSRYKEVHFFVPNFAMSAGTVLVMSGDAIWMNYFSILGPIDPQVLRPESNNFIPATGYLIQYERLMEKSAKGRLSTAELAYLIEKFDPGDLYAYEQQRELSVSLLKQWLVRYKFKNWTTTETRKEPVTNQLKEQRAEAIARALNDPERWHSHSRGIGMDRLRDELKLVIEDFDKDPGVRDALKGYYGLLQRLRSTAWSPGRGSYAYVVSAGNLMEGDMAQEHDRTKLIEANPLVDADQLREASEALEALRRTGLSLSKGAQFSIESPFKRRLAPADEDEASAAVRLTRH